MQRETSIVNANIYSVVAQFRLQILAVNATNMGCQTDALAFMLQTQYAEVLHICNEMRV